ncbi:hypothetical protein BRC99_00890 [Halobacteriales archaeon QS_7_69_60]|nr:MAG: hypothetical protein BRC99_00890 [Halobacteriales archaeon QS_7_69_60]
MAYQRVADDDGERTDRGAAVLPGEDAEPDEQRDDAGDAGVAERLSGDFRVHTTVVPAREQKGTRSIRERTE